MSFLIVFLPVVQTKPHFRCLTDEVTDRAILRYQIEGMILTDTEVDIHLGIVGNSHQRFINTTANKRTHMPRNH